jgi:hypothetical protein
MSLQIARFHHHRSDAQLGRKCSASPYKTSKAYHPTLASQTIFFPFQKILAYTDAHTVITICAPMGSMGPSFSVHDRCTPQHVSPIAVKSRDTDNEGGARRSVTTACWKSLLAPRTTWLGLSRLGQVSQLSLEESEYWSGYVSLPHGCS